MAIWLACFTSSRAAGHRTAAIKHDAEGGRVVQEQGNEPPDAIEEVFYDIGEWCYLNLREAREVKTTKVGDILEGNDVD